MDGKVSIIVPVYKVEAYLSRCLNSLVNQTYENIEIILVDGGSPDKSGIICDEYAKKDKRIKVIHQENRGVSSARNAGLQIAEGEYIGFVDSDSLSHRNKAFEEILLSLCEVLRLQKKYENMALKYTELFFVETVWKYWIVKVAQSREYKRLKDFKEHEKIKNEILSCKETYYNSPYVKKYKKVIVYMLLKHEHILFFVIKLTGCLVR